MIIKIMYKRNIRVPYGLSVHGSEEIKAVNKVLKSSTQMGKNVSIFEKKISKLFSKKIRFNGKFWFICFITCNGNSKYS